MTPKTQVIITAKDETGSAIASAKRGLDSLATAGAGLQNKFGFLAEVGGLAGLLGGASLAATVKQSIDSLDKLDEAAERVGVSVESLSALNFAGKLSGLEFDDVTQAVTKLSVKMQEAASGNKEAIALFADLGLKVTDSAGKLKSADAMLDEIADKFGGLEDGVGKTAWAVDAFGKSGAKLVPLLNQGSAGLASMRSEAESLGAVVDGKLAKQAAQFNDNLDRLSFVSAAAGKAIAAELLPTLNRLSEELLIGLKNSDGFLDALLKYGLTNPFSNQEEKLAGLRAEFEQLDFALSNGRSKNEAEDRQRLKSLEQQINYYAQIKALRDGRDQPAPAAEAPKKEIKRTPSGGDGKKQVDEALKLIQSLDEQIALKQADAASTDKMSSAEAQAVKVRYQLEAGTLKATAAQRAAINIKLEELVALDKTLAAQNAFNEALKKQEEANVKNNQALFDQIASTQQAVDTFGLSELQISKVVEARLRDVIAIAQQSGATQDQLDYLQRELDLRAQLNEQMEALETRRLIGNTDTAKYAKQHQDIELLNKAMREGKITETEYDEAINAMMGKSQEALGNMEAFAQSAAHNMQSALADLFINPTNNGFKGLADRFGQTVQKMIAEAASAKIMQTLFGTMGGTTGGKSTGTGGSDWGWVGQAVSWAAAFFADGGIMTQNGPVPLRKYAGGGIANSPQFAMFGEGSTPEAYVPLPDGRRIPVAMQGGQGGMTIHQTIYAGDNTDKAEIRRSAAAGARAVLGAMNGAQRYA